MSNGRTGQHLDQQESIKETKHEFPNIIMKNVIHTTHASGLIRVIHGHQITSLHIGVSSTKTISLSRKRYHTPDLLSTIGSSGLFFLCWFDSSRTRNELAGKAKTYHGQIKQRCSDQRRNMILERWALINPVYSDRAFIFFTVGLNNTYTLYDKKTTTNQTSLWFLDHKFCSLSFNSMPCVH